MKILITIWFCLLMSNLYGQCDYPTNCLDVSPSYTLYPATQIDNFEPFILSYCVDPDSNDIHIDTTGLYGEAFATYFSLEIQDSTSVVFISVSQIGSLLNNIVNIYTHQDCDNFVLYRTTLNDISKNVLDIEVEPNENYLVEVLTPTTHVEERTDYTISALGLAELEICEPQDYSGANNELIMEVISRTVGELDDTVYYPGERVLLQLDYVFAQPVQNFPTWLHYVTFLSSNGWTVIDSITNVSIKQSFDTDLQGEYSIEGDCGVRSRVDLPYYCTYTDDNGEIVLCHMLTQNCPCSGLSVASENLLPGGWTFTRNAPNCPDSCSPSDRWGVGFISSDLNIDIWLQIDTILNLSELQLGIFITTDAITGCYEPSQEFCLPHMVSWTDPLTVVDPSEIYGVIRYPDPTFERVCFKDSLEVELLVNEIGDKNVYLRQKINDYLTNGEDLIAVNQDTIIKLYRENISDTIVNEVLEIVVIESSYENVLYSKSISYLPYLWTQNDTLLICNNGCNFVELDFNVDINATVSWSDGEIGAGRTVCASDSFPLTYAFETNGCFSDTFELTTFELEPLEIVVDKPTYLCSDGIQKPLLERPTIVIDTITGGTGNYDYSWFIIGSTITGTTDVINGKPAIRIKEENVSNSSEFFRARFTLGDDNDCTDIYDIRVNTLNDTMITLDPACKDGLFDPMNPEFTVTVPNFYDKSISNVNWWPTNGLQGFEENDISFVIDEETSPMLINEDVLRADIFYEDACELSVDYKLTLFTPDRSFIYDIVDFEVDFTPTDLIGFISVLWDFGDGNTSAEVFPTHIYEEKGFYDVTMMVTDPCTTMTKVITIEVGPVAADDISIDKLHLFPNPAFDKFTLSSEYEIDEIFLYDIHGSLIDKWILDSNHEFTIDIGNLSEGMYFVNVLGSKGSQVKPFMKFK